MSKPTFTIGVFAAIFDQEKRILLCHRTDYDLWNLPGGTLEHGEAPWEGVVREVKEETGLVVKIAKLAGVYCKTDKNELVFQFVCTVIGGAITLNPEADKIEYFIFNNIPKNTSPKQVDRIKDVLDDFSDLVMKVHTGKSSFQLIEEGLL